MAGVCEFIAVLSGSQWLVCVDCCYVRSQMEGVCELLPMAGVCDLPLFSQEANGLVAILS